MKKKEEEEEEEEMKKKKKKKKTKEGSSQGHLRVISGSPQGFSLTQTVHKSANPHKSQQNQFEQNKPYKIYTQKLNTILKNYPFDTTRTRARTTEKNRNKHKQNGAGQLKPLPEADRPITPGHLQQHKQKISVKPFFKFIF